MNKLWSRFLQWLASAEIDKAVQARLNALANVFPEFAKLLSERAAANSKAMAARENEKATLLAKLADIDVEIQKHQDFEAAVELLTAK